MDSLVSTDCIDLNYHCSYGFLFLRYFASACIDSNNSAGFNSVVSGEHDIFVVATLICS